MSVQYAKRGYHAHSWTQYTCITTPELLEGPFYVRDVCKCRPCSYEYANMSWPVYKGIHSKGRSGNARWYYTRARHRCTGYPYLQALTERIRRNLARQCHWILQRLHYHGSASSHQWHHPPITANVRQVHFPSGRTAYQ